MAVDQNKLARWFQLTEELPAKVAEEKALRQELFAQAFPNPKLGTNRFTLGHGKDLVATHKMSYTVDRAAMDTLKDTVPAQLFHDIITFSPGVRVGGWNAASVQEKLYFAEFVTEKPALPSMEIANVKKRG